MALDPDLADEWTGLAPVRDHAALAMSHLADSIKDDKNPDTFRYVIGLREGWEERKAAKVAERVATAEG